MTTGYLFTWKEFALAAACVLALGVLSETALAQPRDINKHALLLDWRGAPVMSNFGLCVRTGFGPAPQWIRGCYAEVPAPVAQYVPVAPVAMPAPVPEPLGAAAAAPLPVYEKVVFDANVLFDSNKSALRAAGRDTLDQFVASIYGLDSQSIRATGYGDRTGSHASNQILSRQRVDAVKAYLVGRGIAPNRVQTSARGETGPDALARKCERANSATNIACMQPDRHVFIEISGIRIAK